MAGNALESVISIMALFADYASALDERRFNDLDRTVL